MVHQFLFVLLLYSKGSYASTLGTSLGETVGYTFIGICGFLVVCTGLFIIIKPSNKGTPSSLIQIILFLQFTRYTTLFNFQHSSFYIKLWQTFNQIQNPYNFLSCGNSIAEPWSLLGFTTSNFVCNSISQLIIISLILVIWLVLPLFYPKIKGKR